MSFAAARFPEGVAGLRDAFRRRSFLAVIPVVDLLAGFFFSAVLRAGFLAVGAAPARRRASVRFGAMSW